jgi:outer membrane protein
MKSAELGIPLAKVDALPRVVLFAGLDTRFSSISNFKNDPYFDQLDRNFGQTIGAQINIPIYNNHRTSIALENARLGIINSEVQNKQAKQKLKADVQNAIANARASRKELEAARTSVEAAKAAFENAEKRYKLGNINSLELTTAKTNLDTAELNLARAKYDYVFRTKIIDFYLGKELNLN